jgi:glutamate formiminotransferase/glutamate formiminotransferase/formiminotetrahydrofolate cyclodeaminase
VPNFSEGRDLARVAALESTIAAIPGVIVLDRTSDIDHNRSVITFAGSPEPVLEAAIRVAAKAAELIDLTTHQGVHPRLGALDVLPFVPLRGVSLADCAELAHRAGDRIWNELRIPVYFYEAAARRVECRKLEDARRGTCPPDLGGPALHPTAGAVIVGARKVLIAFNINLATADIEIAKDIARSIRASSGGLPGVKALGLRLASRGLVQVSMNLTDFEQTSVHTVFDQVKLLAAAHGVEVADSELIGLLPRQAVENAFAHFVKLPSFDSGRVIENRLDLLRIM